MSALQEFRDHLRPGSVYRRSDLMKLSSTADRYLNLLQKDNTVLKLSGGMYYLPKSTSFGNAPPADENLIAAFLKDDRFLVMTPNAYNALRIGTTQLYNETVVYNHKRHGQFKLGSRTFRFVMKHYFPNELSTEFLLVDLVDNLKRLAEDNENVLKFVGEKARLMNQDDLQRAIHLYGGTRAKKYFATALKDALR